MTNLNLKNIIPKIIENVNFRNYLESIGYTLIDNSSDGYKLSFLKETLYFTEVLFLFNVEDTIEYYSSTFRDSGSIINFVKNRIEINDTYSDFNPHVNPIIESCKILLEYLHNINDDDISYDLKTIEREEFKFFQHNTFTKLYKAYPLDSTSYLEKKNIKKATLKNELFKGKFFNTSGLYYNDKSYEIVNTTYPLYNIEDKEVGLIHLNQIHDSEQNIKEDISIAAKGSDIDQGFWKSNTLKLHKSTKTKLTLVDNPVEALSHYEFYKEKREYISFYKLKEQHVDTLIYKLKETNGYLNLASSTSLYNFTFELKTIIKILGLKHHIFLTEDTINSLTFEIEGGTSLKPFMDRIKRQNTRIINSVIQSVGQSSKKYLESQIVKANMSANNMVVFKIPKTLQTLYYISKNLLDSFDSDYSISIEKTSYFKWNNTIKNKEFSTKKNSKSFIEIASFGCKNINY